MPIQSITIVLIRSFALWWLIKGILGLLLITLPWDGSDSGLPELATALLTLLYPLSATLVWIYAPTFARFASRGCNGDATLSGVTRRDLYATAFITVGTCYFLTSIGPLIGWVHYFVIEGLANPDEGDLYSLFEEVVKTLASVTLVLSASLLSRKLAARDLKSEVPVSEE